MAGVNQHRKNLMECLETGKFTDCTFRVGPVGSKELEEVHAVKAVMMMSSPYIAKLFDEKLSSESPIRITNVKSGIFKLLVRFAHTCCLKAISTEEKTDLFIAADHFKFEGLRAHCSEMIKNSVKEDLIWYVAGKLIRAAHSSLHEAVNILEYLWKNTDKCLAFPSYLYATPAGITLLMQQDSLHMKSEYELVLACQEWALTNSYGNKRMRSLLPHIRLLTMTAKEVASLDFLDDDEAGIVMRYILLGWNPEERQDFPTQLCAITTPRKFTLV